MKQKIIIILSLAVVACTGCNSNSRTDQVKDSVIVDSIMPVDSVIVDTTPLPDTAIVDTI